MLSIKYEFTLKEGILLHHTKSISLGLCLLLTLSACGSTASSSAAPVTSSTPTAAISTESTEEAKTSNITADAEFSTDLFAMDTYMTLKAYGSGAQSALNDISSMISTLDSQLSVTNTESEIYQLNHAEGQEVSLSDTTADLIEKALTLGSTTNGALELTSYPLSLAWGFTTGDYQIPDQETIDGLLPLVDDSAIALDGTSATLPSGAQLDLGAVAKGYAADRAAELLQDAGVTSALLNLGSSTIRAVGSKPDGSPWRIALQDPNDTSAYAGVVSATDLAIDTSGGYERYFEGDDGEIYWHILDPDTGYPAKSGLISVTVLSDSALTGDGLSTALFVMGLDDAIDYWRTNGGFDFIFITDQNEIYVSQGAESLFQPLGSYENAEIHVVMEAS